MRKQIKIKQLVAILLPIVFILGIVYSISSMISLRADDSSTQLIVQKGDEDITGKDISISETSVNLNLTAKVSQLYRLSPKDKLSISLPDSDSRELSARNIRSDDFDLEKELSALKDTDKEKQSTELIYVTDSDTGEVTTYLKLLKDETEKVTFSREHTGEEFAVKFENTENRDKQNLFKFVSIKLDEPQESSEPLEESSETNTEETKKSKPLKGNETIEELEKRDYSETESFKPIELPLDENKSKRDTKGLASINVTGAKLTVRSGTAGFDDPKDGSTHPGYDKNDENEWVRTFDSSIYLLTFSLEGSDPGVTYSNIKYRVDMNLPNAYGFDTAGKKRNNFKIVTDESDGLTLESNGTETENGYVESTINANGQILLPIFVNVLGAQHNTKINPKLKITIISATNDKTGTEETLNKVYDENNLPVLSVPEKKVSAKASLTSEIQRGTTAPFANTISGGTWSSATRNNWQVAGVGVGIKLKALSGRTSDDFRGATFPVGKISFTINTPTNYYALSSASGSPTYSVATGTSETDATKAYPIKIIAGASGTLSTTTSDWHWFKHTGASRTLNVNKDVLSKDIPFGKTGSIYHKEPTDFDKSKIGVYDTGNVAVKTDTTVEIDNYEPMWNPYTYNMRENPIGKNEKYFASASLLLEWSNLYFSQIAASNYKIYYSDLTISNLSYESESHAGEGKASLSVRWSPVNTSQHMLWAYPNDGVEQGKDIYGNNTVWDASGRGSVSKGTKMDLVTRHNDEDYGTGTKYKSKEFISYTRWNANSAKFDPTRKVFLDKSTSPINYYFGVKKTADPAPSRSSLTQTQMDSQYTWYAKQEDAVAAGEISALKIYSKREVVDRQFTFSVSVPVIATGPVNSDSDMNGNRNIALYNTFSNNVNANGTDSNSAWPPIGTVYEPTVFDINGIATRTHRANTGGVLNTDYTSTKGGLGDSFWIKGVGITTTTKPEKDTYKTDELAKWKVTGNVSGGSVDHTVTIKSTLPKGLSYVSGSKSVAGGTLKSENVVKNADDTTTITWVIEKVNASKDVPEVTFETKSDVAKLTFTDSSVSEVTVYSVGEIFVTGSPTEKDDSPLFVRESSGKVQLYQMQKISLEKKVEPEYIEVGSKDPANPSLSTDIKYKIKLVNNSSDKLVNVKVLDALPYNGDSLGTHFNGSYTVTGLNFLTGTGKVTYTNSRPPDIENRDPNTITGWGTYVPGVSNVSTIRSAQAFLVSLDEMAVDEELEFEITISPTGQKAGDIYQNRASFNSSIDLPVKSNIVETKVYGRDLKGSVWYDDDYDGLIGNKSDGSPEDPVGNIPVKLYRTSLKNTSYQEQLVQESLTGEKFVDGSGDSLIKTDSNGKYQFDNLPEGEYLAEFIVGDLVTQKIVIVTKRFVGSDESKNSKANPNTYKTPEYRQPELNELTTLLNGTDKVYHVNYVNAGLTPLSKIRLFKYEEGTVVDSNNDGKLSDTEIEASGKPLKNAEFDIYKGNSTNSADKIGSAKTDGTGWLEFEGGLPPGDYTIVETKAPAGFELLKDPIKVTVPTYNYVAVVHVADKGQTKLPFTGSTKAMRIILIAAAVLMV
ncbi:SpaA isopeptide-forming pilin-related protein, partial [Enterococcus hulanensis]